MHHAGMTMKVKTTEHTKAVTQNVMDDNPTVPELIESFINGNITWVGAELWKYPPHITALVVLHLCQRDMVEDANRLTNILLEHFEEQKDDLLYS